MLLFNILLLISLYSLQKYCTMPMLLYTILLSCIVIQLDFGDNATIHAVASFAAGKNLGVLCMQLHSCKRSPPHCKHPLYSPATSQCRAHHRSSGVQHRPGLVRGQNWTGYGLTDPRVMSVLITLPGSCCTADHNTILDMPSEKDQKNTLCAKSHSSRLDKRTIIQTVKNNK